MVLRRIVLEASGQAGLGQPGSGACQVMGGALKVLNGSRCDLMHVVQSELNELRSWRCSAVSCRYVWNGNVQLKPLPGNGMRVLRLLEVPQPSYRFAIVRNPYSRVISSFRYLFMLKMAGSMSPRARKLSQLLGFDASWAPHRDNLTVVLGAMRDQLANGVIQWVGGVGSFGLTHFRPATAYTHPAGGPAVDQVLRLERLERDVRRLLRSMFPTLSATSVDMLIAQLQKRGGAKASASAPPGRAPPGRARRAGRGLSLGVYVPSRNGRRLSPVAATRDPLAGHNHESLSLTEQLYSRDFALLGYAKAPAGATPQPLYHLPKHHSLPKHRVPTPRSGGADALLGRPRLPPLHYLPEHNEQELVTWLAEKLGLGFNKQMFGALGRAELGELLEQHDRLLVSSGSHIAAAKLLEESLPELPMGHTPSRLRLLALLRSLHKTV